MKPRAHNSICGSTSGYYGTLQQADWPICGIKHVYAAWYIVVDILELLEAVVELSQMVGDSRMLAYFAHARCFFRQELEYVYHAHKGWFAKLQVSPTAMLSMLTSDDAWGSGQHCTVYGGWPRRKSKKAKRVESVWGAYRVRVKRKKFHPLQLRKTASFKRGSVHLVLISTRPTRSTRAVHSYRVASSIQSLTLPCCVAPLWAGQWIRTCTAKRKVPQSPAIRGGTLALALERFRGTTCPVHQHTWTDLEE